MTKCRDHLLTEIKDLFEIIYKLSDCCDKMMDNSRDTSNITRKTNEMM